MWEALRVACADGFVRAHADGLDMRVAQGGINFSGGQRQRLAIARAVIRAPAVYLFDDALSALDVHTDARVRDQLREVAADSTVIIVAQRISTVMGADQVIVLEDGHVVGAGTHETLLTECPAYAQFADSQSLGVGAGESDRERTHAGRDAHAAGTRRAVARLPRNRRPAGQATDTAARADHGGDRIGSVRDRHRGDRPAHPRPRHRPVVQRCDRPATARRHHQGTGHRRGARPRGQHVRRPAVGNERDTGPRRGLRRGRAHAAAGAGAVSRCGAAGVDSGAAAQRRGAADDGGAAGRRRGQGPPTSAVALRFPRSAANC